MNQSVLTNRLVANRKKFLTLLQLIGFFTALVAINSILFHFVMSMEGRSFTAFAGVYWTLITMSTLGYGDIVFRSDIGHVFSIMVLLSGMVCFLIVLPVAFIRFFYEPWVEAREAARTPRFLEKSVESHVILTNYGPVTSSLIKKLSHFSTPYVFVVEDEAEALKLYDRNLNVVIGKLSDPETYNKVNVDKAALVAVTGTDVKNTNVVFTVRGVSDRVPIVATADRSDSVDILELAGCNHVVDIAEMLGFALARRVIGGDSLSHEIGRIGNIVIAEANTSHTPLVGRKFQDLDIRHRFDINIAGMWERGTFKAATADVEITPNSSLVLAGTRESLVKYDAEFGHYHTEQAPVIILGCGRVGLSTARALEKRGVEHRIVEKNVTVLPGDPRVIRGDAAARDVIDKAGIMSCSTVIVTTNDDDINVYLTLYCRKLRPEIQIISRVTLERNIDTLHRAGADFVLSYSSMGTNVIFNLLKRNDILMIAEGLDIFSQETPNCLIGKTILESEIRPSTGCSVIAISEGDDFSVSPDINIPLKAENELILIGDAKAEKRFLKKFASGANKSSESSAWGFFSRN